MTLIEDTRATHRLADTGYRPAGRMRAHPSEMDRTATGNPPPAPFPQEVTR